MCVCLCVLILCIPCLCVVSLMCAEEAGALFEGKDMAQVGGCLCVCSMFVCVLCFVCAGEAGTLGVGWGGVGVRGGGGHTGKGVNFATETSVRPVWQSEGEGTNTLPALDALINCVRTASGERCGLCECLCLVEWVGMRCEMWDFSIQSMPVYVHVCLCVSTCVSAAADECDSEPGCAAGPRQGSSDTTGTQPGAAAAGELCRCVCSGGVCVCVRGGEAVCVRVCALVVCVCGGGGLWREGQGREGVCAKDSSTQ